MSGSTYSLEAALGRYQLFAGICLVYFAATIWLILRKKLTLQASLLYLLLMAGAAAASLLLHFFPGFVEALGFALPANLLFATAIGVLAFLHLMGLASLSRVERRTTTLVQELGLLREEVARLRQEESSGSEADEVGTRQANEQPAGTA